MKMIYVVTQTRIILSGMFRGAKVERELEFVDPEEAEKYNVKYTSKPATGSAYMVIRTKLTDRIVPDYYEIKQPKV